MNYNTEREKQGHKMVNYLSQTELSKKGNSWMRWPGSLLSCVANVFIWGECLWSGFFMTIKWLISDTSVTIKKAYCHVFTLHECSWIGIIDIVKVSILLKAIYRFKAISIKIPKASFIEIEKIILNFIWNHKKLLRDKAIFRKNRAGGITYSDFKIYYNIIIIKMVRWWH